MRKPFQMYSKLGNLKIIKLKTISSNLDIHNPGDISPYNFIGVYNHKLTSGLILSSKINRLRKDGMYIKYFNNHHSLSNVKTPIGLNIKTLPLPLEYKLYGFQLIAKKYIKSLFFGVLIFSPFY